MSMVTFKSVGMDNLQKEIARLAYETAPKESKKFMGQEGLKLARKMKSVLKTVVHKKTGNLTSNKYLKRGRVYTYEDSTYETRIHFAPHTHLWEYGFNHISGKRVQGHNRIRPLEAQFSETFTQDFDSFVDEIIKDF